MGKQGEVLLNREPFTPTQAELSITTIGDHCWGMFQLFWLAVYIWPEERRPQACAELPVSYVSFNRHGCFAGLPVIGTKRTGSVRCLTTPRSVFVMIIISWLVVPTGMTIRPPVASCAINASGN